MIPVPAGVRVWLAAGDREGDPVLDLLPVLTDGHTHAVIVTGGAEHLAGIITQSHVLVAIGRMLLNRLGTATGA